MIRARFKLTNAIDDALARDGKMSASGVRTCEVDALVNPETVCTVIPSTVARRLGLSLVGLHDADDLSGLRKSGARAEAVLVDWQGRDTVEGPIVLGDEVIIGRTVLMKLDLVLDHARQQVVPNPAHPDYPVSKIK